MDRRRIVFSDGLWLHSVALGVNGMNQVARNTDPLTSWAAADSAKALAAQHATIIIQALCKYGAMGKDGIAQITELDGNQVARRLSELERNHEILLTGRNAVSYTHLTLPTNREV